MECDEPFLHIGPGTHLLRGAYEHPDLSCPYPGKQSLFLYIRIRLVYEPYLFCRYPLCDKFRPDIIIHIE